MTEPRCELLDWDSRFFGIRIARLFDTTLDEPRCAAVLQWSREHQVRCLYFLASPDDAATIAIAERNGFHLVDMRVELDRDIKGPTETTTPGEAGNDARPLIRTAQADDLPRLRELAADGHRITRFYQDGHFPRERCDELYRIWITNSVGRPGTSVFVATDKARIDGYVTVVAEGDVDRIGLIAVDSAARGRGHGGRLLEAAIDLATRRGARQMVVATQAGNTDALRLYERHGFRVGRVGLWFHRWFD